MELFEEIQGIGGAEEDTGAVSFIQVKQASVRPRFEAVLADSLASGPMTALAQFFVAPIMWTDVHAVWHIPVREDGVYRQILCEIAPHFEKTTKVTTGEAVQVNLQGLREHSKSMFMSLVSDHRLHPIVEDLYARKADDEQMPAGRTKSYKVNLQAIAAHLPQEHAFRELWDFFKHTFIHHQEILILMPVNWTFDETFKDSVAIKAFAGVCTSMSVQVNEQKRITALCMQ